MLRDGTVRIGDVESERSTAVDKVVLEANSAEGCAVWPTNRKAKRRLRRIVKEVNQVWTSGCNVDRGHSGGEYSTILWGS